MALTPAQLAELQRLRQVFVPLAEQAKRDAQRQSNMDAMNPQNKAGGGLLMGPNGKPLRVYHGTNQDIKQFSNKRLGQNTNTSSSIAHFFTEHPDEANEYAQMAARRQVTNAPSHEKQVAKLQSAIQKAERAGNWDEAERLYLQLEELDLGAINEEPSGQNIIPAHIVGSKFKTVNMGHSFDADKLAQEIKQAKVAKLHGLKLENVYDPVGERPSAFSTNQWVVFDPKRIKSAIGNRGTYDPTNPDITKAEGGAVKNPFDYENADHVSNVAGIASKHKDFSHIPQAAHHLGEVLSTGNWKHLEDPRIQGAIRRAGHDSYYVAEKTGKQHHVIKKAEGGNVAPSMAQMRMALAQRGTNIDLKNVGVNEAPSMAPKHFFPADKSDIGMPSPGGVATPTGMPVGGIDMSRMQPGQQLMPQMQGQQAPAQGQPPQPNQPQGQAPEGPTPPMGNMLQMTPQGQALGAMKGPQQAMAKGGSAKSVDEMKAELKAKKAPADTGKRVTINAEGSGGVKGIVVPRHTLEGNKKAGHILMTTPTESTSNIGHQTSFTHNVSDKHIEHAIANKGEYEIDKPEDQIKAAGKEYRAPQSIKFYAEGGAVGGRHPGFEDDDFHAFPEQNVVAQRHLSMRHGEDEHKHTRLKAPVVVHKNTGTMQLEMILKKKAK